MIKLLPLSTWVVIIFLLAMPAHAVRVNNLGQAPLPATALQKACAVGDLDKVKVLIQNGSRVNQRNAHGTAPMIFAVMSGQTSVVQCLLDNGANVNEKDGATGLYPIHYAAFNDIAMTRLLLDRGADVNAPAGAYGAALNIAVSADDVAMAELLLQQHARTDTTQKIALCGDDGKIVGQETRTLLMTATPGENQDMIKLLAKYGVKVAPVHEQNIGPAKNRFETLHEFPLALLIGAAVVGLCVAIRMRPAVK